jgi:hypothetical protein
MSRVLFAIPFLLLSACDADDGGEAGDPPAAPAQLSVSPVDGGAHLTWQDASDDEDEFMIERKGETGAFTAVDSVPFDTTSYHDASVTPGTWIYRVGAMNDAGESWSDEVSVTIE